MKNLNSTLIIRAG